MMTKEQMRRSTVPYVASLLFHCVGDGRHLTPIPLLPIADCPNCQYMKMEHDGGHCYMFLDKPEGDKCGQMTS